MSFTQTNTNGVVFHTADAFTAAGGVRHGFASRLGGVSPAPWDSLNISLSRGDEPRRVRENYRRLCAALGTDEHCIAMTRQVHSDFIRPVGRKDALQDPLDPLDADADGLITNEPGVCLTIFYADCVPVLLYDPKGKVIAAVHSGWRGTSLAIAAQAAKKMVSEYGSKPEDILAAIGPAIGPCCFETHSDVPDALRERLGDGVSPYMQAKQNVPGKFSVDLKGIIRWELENAGLVPAHIDTLPLCTCCARDLYWSHRRQGGERGNHAAMLQLA